eukprot:Gregarina_sp_Poly_1__9531@NODE_5_length_25086_cov_86_244454_g4_i0_p2_GENE_NODE_5_length_25086_cov_86_244454_g4_i0NODE_5_length_25086_cov_86_244454_g4_i0_p2_ORF_typecomplete_len1835_score275_89zfHC5HC2H_2/PF13832_6/6_3e02zfHC5HC2H_2/PF13832_6/1_1e14zfHC5HC2H_2/PF13832_6/1_8e04zfHC5HC2H_2/PF13832_6/8_6e03zfHC5HC2H_2/PF13832_6/5_7e09zfHC5HC2H_2/PF13832_6/3_1e03zfHC5HC2H_2/PF13832_6/3_5e02zfHC5HC2H_2/PF13832_6/0_0038PHD_2/PF13831_6/3_8e09PHD_2/PF13831_6/3_5e03PHD_2/PF13831_6/2_9e11PHD_2/PF13831_6/30
MRATLPLSTTGQKKSSSAENAKNDYNKYWSQNTTEKALWNIDANYWQALPSQAPSPASPPSSEKTPLKSSPSSSTPAAGFGGKDLAAYTLPATSLSEVKLPALQPFDNCKGHCEVCWSQSAYDTPVSCGELITCEGCGVTVHEGCYGVMRNSGQAWFCGPCLYWLRMGVPRTALTASPESDGSPSAQELSCSICHRIKGAMKIGTEGLWVHVSCLLYTNDGPKFSQFEARANPVDVKQSVTLAAHSQYTCGYCQSSLGFATRCRFPGCRARLHVSCAFLAANFPKLVRVPLENGQERQFAMLTCAEHATDFVRQAILEHEAKLTQPSLRTQQSNTLYRPPMLYPPYAYYSLQSSMQPWSLGYGPAPFAPRPPLFSSYQNFHAFPPNGPFPGFSTFPQRAPASPVLPAAVSSPKAAPKPKSSTTPRVPVRKAKKETAAASVSAPRTARAKAVSVRPTPTPETPALEPVVSVAQPEPETPAPEDTGSATQRRAPRPQPPKKKDKSSSRVAASASTSTTSGARKRDGVSGEDAPDLGTAAGHVLGAAVSTKGVRISWNKLVPHFRCLRSLDDTVFGILQTHLRRLANIETHYDWRWIWDMETESPAETATARRVKLQQVLKTEWCRFCARNSEELPVSFPGTAKAETETETETAERKETETAKTAQRKDTSQREETATEEDAEALVPLTVLVRVEKQRESSSPQTKLLWLYCRTRVREREQWSDQSLQVLPLQALLREVEGVWMRLCPSNSQRSMVETSLQVELAAAFVLNEEFAELLRADICAAERSEILSGCGEARETPSTLQVIRDADSFEALLAETAVAVDDDEDRRTQSRSLDLVNWAEILRTEALVQKKPPQDFFILLKKVTSEAKLKEAVVKGLDPRALLRVIAVSKRVYLSKHIWDLNPPFPVTRMAFRKRLPGRNASVDSPDLVLGETETPPVPISDDLLREWLMAFQKMRSGGQVSSLESAQAAQAGELFRVLSSEQYWRYLLFRDDFVRRQGLYCLLVWTRRRPRLRALLEKTERILRTETVRGRRRLAESDTQVRRLTRQARHAARWSALRASVLAGHQDPGPALVSRVQQEYPRAIAAFGSAPAPAAVPGVNAPTTNPAARLYFCLVCFGPETDNLNPLVTCRRCSIKVHKNCYGIGQPAQLDLDAVEWFCSRCETERKTHPEFVAGSCLCALCTRPGGALKRMSGATNKAFVHVTCGLWCAPFVRCHDLHRLTDWRFQREDLRSVVETAQPCSVCARAQFKKRASYRIVVAEEEEEDIDSRAVAQAEARLSRSSTPELPLAQIGYTLKCADCDLHMHPMCAWLAGFKVDVANDFSVDVSPESGLLLPGLRFQIHCNRHSRTRTPRLPLDTISRHRRRAYLCNDTPLDTPLTAEEDSLQQEDLALACSKELPTASEAVAAARAETGTAAYFPALPMARSILAGRDIYLDNICQACLELVSPERPALRCQSCPVLCHTECAVGVFIDAANPRCTFCRQGSVVHCAVCPRVGGALCEISRAVVAALLLEDPGVYLKSSLASCIHKYCLLSQVDQRLRRTLDSWLALEDPRAFQRKGQAMVTLVQESQPEHVSLRAAKRICQVCNMREGCFLRCGVRHCQRHAHPLCAGLAAGVSLSVRVSQTSDATPPRKRRKTQNSVPVDYLCLLHSYEDVHGCCGISEVLAGLNELNSSLRQLRVRGEELCLHLNSQQSNETYIEVTAAESYENPVIDMWKMLTQEAIQRQAAHVAAQEAEAALRTQETQRRAESTAASTPISQHTEAAAGGLPGAATLDADPESSTRSSRRKRKRTIVDSDDEDEAVAADQSTSSKRRRMNVRNRRRANKFLD